MNDKSSVDKLVKDLPEQTKGKEERSIKKKPVEHLFAKLSAIYGNKFLDQWTGADFEAVKTTWGNAIADLTPEELRRGIHALIVNGKGYPPSLPDFYVLCRPPVDVPPVTDHKGLDRLAAKLGVSTVGCDSYHALRAKVFETLQSRAEALRLEGPAHG